jgi:hypothetical protein
MILCTVQPNEQYDVTLENITVGLWNQYGHDLHLWNLVSRTAVEFFQYEPGFESIPLTKRPAILYNDKTFDQTLDQKVNGVTVRELLEIMTPFEMIDYFVKVKPDLAILGFFAPFIGIVNPTDEQVFVGMIDSMKLRAWQHKKYFKGKTGQNGKVIQVRFRPSLPADQLALLEQSCDVLLKMFKRTIGEVS